MKCQNCGFEAQENDKFCRNCGNELIEPKMENNEEEPLEAEVIDGVFEGDTVEEKKFFDDPKKVTILGAVLFFNSWILSLIPSGVAISTLLIPLSLPCSLVGLAIIIYARSKFPDYTPAKVLLWLVIILLVLFVILIIWMISACLEACSDCQYYGYYEIMMMNCLRG